MFIVVWGSVTRGHQRNGCLSREGPGVRIVSRRSTHGTGVVNDLGCAGQSARRRGISKYGSRNKGRAVHVSESDLSMEHLVGRWGNRLWPDPEEPLA